ncbi:hypothetical protein FIBSPDRAFT_177997 [Athelia psychrophila]|uniref:Uncharacterized protein n=1 Tax=Athelia psychrophila TaxID=1759441 RepID=A0A166SPH1_9AGAM|nr:hypothetical protein FIBSPDRAFT_177997 [Fibularhizoctonia sp. CBS 109695]
MRLCAATRGGAVASCDVRVLVAGCFDGATIPSRAARCCSTAAPASAGGLNAAQTSARDFTTTKRRYAPVHPLAQPSAPLPAGSGSSGSPRPSPRPRRLQGRCRPATPRPRGSACAGLCSCRR